MVQIEFWERSNFYCLSRKGETAQEYSREKKPGYNDTLGKLGTNKALPREHQPGRYYPKQLPAILIGG